MCDVDLYFFFQAEDGIRDVAVTGVQTCALPISPASAQSPQVRTCSRMDLAQQRRIRADWTPATRAPGRRLPLLPLPARPQRFGSSRHSVQASEIDTNLPVPIAV